MFKIILGLICSMSVGYLGGLAQNRKESYKAYLKEKQDGIDFSIDVIHSYKQGKDSAYTEIKEIIKGE